jgi:hypothetical protein
MQMNGKVCIITGTGAVWVARATARNTRGTRRGDDDRADGAGRCCSDDLVCSGLEVLRLMPRS